MSTIKAVLMILNGENKIGCNINSQSYVEHFLVNSIRNPLQRHGMGTENAFDIERDER